MDSPSQVLLNSLRVLEGRRCVGAVLRLRGSMALELGLTDEASDTADRMLALGFPGWRTIKAEALRTKGWIREAVRIAKYEYEVTDSGRAALILAESYADLGDLKKAGDYGVRAAERAVRTADLRLFMNCLVAM